MEFAAVDFLNLEIIKRFDISGNHQAVLNDRSHTKLTHFSFSTGINSQRFSQEQRVLAASIDVDDS